MPLFLIWSQKSTEGGQAVSFDVLMKEMFSAFKAGGENDLKVWARVNKNRIGSDFILFIADGANRNNSEVLFQIARILAIENGEKKNLAYVFLFNGKNLSQKSDYINAIKLFQEAEIYFNQVNDFLGLGNVNVELGQIYFLTGEINKALVSYKKALPFFERVNAPIGQGNVYFGMGLIHKFLGENTKAFTMYKKALPFFERAQDYIGQGNIYFALGKIHAHKSENAKALIMYEKALPFFEISQDPHGQGNVYEGKGDLHYFEGENAKALEMYEKAQAFFKIAQDPLGQGNVLKAEGNVYTRTGENDKAISMYDEALACYEKARNPLGQGNVFTAEGDIFLRTGEYAKALEMYDKALSFLKIDNSPISLGNLYVSMGEIYFYTGEYSKALAMYDKALPLFEKAKEPLGQGRVYSKKGRVYYDMGDNAEALTNINTALTFFEKANEPVGQGNLYKEIGNIYSRSDEIEKALMMYEKALAFFNKAQEPIGQSNVFIEEGDIYLHSGDIPKALYMYGKALPLFLKAQDPLGLGNMYVKYGQLYFNINENNMALEMYDKALVCFEKVNDSIGQGNVYFSKGEIQSRSGERSKAFEMYEKALLFFDKIQEPIGKGNVYKKIGNLYFLEDKISNALAMYDEAISQFTKVGSIENTAYIFIEKASVLFRQGKKIEAINLFEAALANLEKVRTQASILGLKKSYFQKNFIHYDSAALFILDNGYPEKGFRIVESMKARVFLDQLAENLANVNKGLDPDLRERQDVLIRKLSILAKEIEQTTGMDSKDRLMALKSERDNVQAEFENLQIEIRLKNPAYSLVRYPEPVSLDELQQKVLRPGEVLVEYYLSTEKAFAFIITNKKFNAVELTVGSNKIRSTLRGYLGWIGKPNSKSAESEKQISAGAALYDQLIKPLSSYFSEGTTIIFVPDDVLAKLPFESLVVTMDPVSREPVYLLEKNLIKYVQSASVLAFLRLQFKQEGVTDAFIGFGDPVYDYENFMKSKQEKGSTQALKSDDLAELNRDRFTREGGTFSRLEGSGQEVTEIAKLFKTLGKANPKLRLDATEEFAKSSTMADYGYIQFSCHGLLGDGYQCLVLSQIPGAREDGFLTLSEFMNSSYKARLVVLSACKTGKGIEERGEGVTGLTRAVMYAGSPAAVVSLWSVSDQVTKDFMVGFYRNMLVNSLSKSEALRAAKLEILKGTTKFHISDKAEISINHPFFWAAFVMYGE